MLCPLFLFPGAPPGVSGWNPRFEAKSERKTRTKKSSGQGGGACLAGEWGDGEVACSLPA